MNHSNNIKLEKIKVDSFSAIDLGIEKGSITQLSFDSPNTRSKIIHETLLAASDRIFKEKSEEVSLAQTTSGLCPAIELTRSVISLSKNLTLAELLGLDQLIEKVFLEEGRLFCKKHQNEFIEYGPDSFSETDVEKLKVLSGTLALTRELELDHENREVLFTQEVRKAITQGELKDLTDVANGERAEVVLETFGSSGLDVIRMRESINRSLSTGVPTVKLQLIGSKGYEREFSFGYLAPDCGCSSPVVKKSELVVSKIDQFGNLSLKLEGFELHEILELKPSELEGLSQEFASLIEPLMSLKFKLNQIVKLLSMEEAIECFLAALNFKEISEALVVVEDLGFIWNKKFQEQIKMLNQRSNTIVIHSCAKTRFPLASHSLSFKEEKQQLQIVENSFSESQATFSAEVKEFSNKGISCPNYKLLEKSACLLTAAGGEQLLTEFFGSLPGARKLGLKQEDFSLGGKLACKNCKGLGCSFCGELGFSEEVLAVEISEMNISDILNARPTDLITLFRSNKDIKEWLESLIALKLGNYPLNYSVKFVGLADLARLGLVDLFAGESSGVMNPEGKFDHIHWQFLFDGSSPQVFENTSEILKKVSANKAFIQESKIPLTF